MEKYNIELSAEQMRLIANCLEDVSRFAAGQCEMRYTTEDMLLGWSHSEKIKRRNEANELLKQVKRKLLPELSENESIGYDGTDFIGNVYQIYRTILHQFAVDEKWDNVYSSPALPSGNLGGIKIFKTN